MFAEMVLALMYLTTCNDKAGWGVERSRFGRAQLFTRERVDLESSGPRLMCILKARSSCTFPMLRKTKSSDS